MREEVLDRLWGEAEPSFFGTRDDFVRQWDGWEMVAVEEAGCVTFIALVLGPRFHFHSFRTGTRLSLARIRTFLQDLIDRHGYAETRTPITDGRQQRFNRKLGFSEAGRDEYDIIYRIRRINPLCRP